jgi:hypothetical protein
MVQAIAPPLDPPQLDLTEAVSGPGQGTTQSRSHSGTIEMGHYVDSRGGGSRTDPDI